MTTTLTVIRAEAGYNVLQAIIEPTNTKSLMRIVTPAMPQRAWRQGHVPEVGSPWKNIESREIQVEDSVVEALSAFDTPREFLDKVAKLFPRWGVKAAAIALVQEED